MAFKFETRETEYILNRAKSEFIEKLSLINWEKAGQWMQYTDYKYIEEYKTVELYFKSSNGGIDFTIKVRCFPSEGCKPLIEFSEAYNFFKKLKYQNEPK